MFSHVPALECYIWWSFIPPPPPPPTLITGLLIHDVSQMLSYTIDIQDKSLLPSNQHITLDSSAGSAWFTGELISRLWPWTQQREFSFSNHMNTSQVPEANFDGSTVITSPGHLPESP